MNTIRIPFRTVCAAMAAAAMLAPLPSLAASTASSQARAQPLAPSARYDRRMDYRHGERWAAPTDAIHSGGGSASDRLLAERVASALEQDPRIDGATVTVVANNGAVSLAGSAKSPEQSFHAQQIAREIAGLGAVSGELSPQGG